jgi:hypothetical protein
MPKRTTTPKRTTAWIAHPGVEPARRRRRSRRRRRRRGAQSLPRSWRPPPPPHTERSSSRYSCFLVTRAIAATMNLLRLLEVAGKVAVSPHRKKG